MVAPAVIAGIGLAAGAAGNIVSGIMGNRAQQRASREQLRFFREQQRRREALGREGADIAGSSFGRAQQLLRGQRGTFEPFAQAGQQGIDALSGLLGQSGTISPEALENAPGYQFRLQEGMKALERRAAAQGGLGGGTRQKELLRFSQGLASQEFENAFLRRQTELTRQQLVAGQLAQIGEFGASGIANLAGNQANLLGQQAQVQGGLIAGTQVQPQFPNVPISQTPQAVAGVTNQFTNFLQNLAFQNLVSNQGTTGGGGLGGGGTSPGAFGNFQLQQPPTSFAGL